MQYWLVARRDTFCWMGFQQVNKKMPKWSSTEGKDRICNSEFLMELLRNMPDKVAKSLRVASQWNDDQESFPIRDSPKGLTFKWKYEWPSQHKHSARRCHHNLVPWACNGVYFCHQASPLCVSDLQPHNWTKGNHTRKQRQKARLAFFSIFHELHLRKLLWSHNSRWIHR